MTVRLLAIGTDPVLLMTRGEVLKQGAIPLPPPTVWSCLTQPFDPNDFDLIILYHTLSEDERRTIAACQSAKSLHSHHGCQLVRCSAVRLCGFDRGERPTRMPEGIRQMLGSNPTCAPSSSGWLDYPPISFPSFPRTELAFRCSSCAAANSAARRRSSAAFRCCSSSSRRASCWRLFSSACL